MGYAGDLPAGRDDPRFRMAVAQKVGRGMKTLALLVRSRNRSLTVAAPIRAATVRERCSGRACFLRVAALLASALSAPAATFYVTIAGLGGEPDYAQRFKMWAEDIDGSLKKAGGDASVTTLNAPQLEQIRTRFTDLAKQAKPADLLVVILIGHGSYDGHDYKFNIPGADLTATELATLLDRVPAQRQLVVNMTSSSGGSIEQLRRPNRIVIAATKPGSEKNATNFARYFAEALREPAADTDKNESISALEAFRYAQTKTTEFFDTQKRLATEHSVIEDTGKGSGERTATAENGQGKLAASFTAVRLGANAAAARDPAKRPLLDKKEPV